MENTLSIIATSAAFASAVVALVASLYARAQAKAAKIQSDQARHITELGKRQLEEMRCQSAEMRRANEIAARAQKVELQLDCSLEWKDGRVRVQICIRNTGSVPAIVQRVYAALEGDREKACWDIGKDGDWTKLGSAGRTVPNGDVNYAVFRGNQEVLATPASDWRTVRALIVEASNETFHVPDDGWLAQLQRGHP